MTIAERLKNVEKEIRTAAIAVGRNPDEIRLVAVSKTRPTEDIAAAFHAGQSIFGENYVQELRAKSPLADERIEWHFIGHLQSNKVRQIAGLVSMIHSVDRISLAEEISRQWSRISLCCDTLVQVNISGEKTKSGATAANALSLVREISQLPHIRLRGLMTMPPFFDEPEVARPYFKELKKLAVMIDKENIPGVEMKELSMGMSGDFRVAIQEGATLVRIGSAIFGERS